MEKKGNNTYKTVVSNLMALLNLAAVSVMNLKIRNSSISRWFPSREVLKVVKYVEHQASIARRLLNK